MSVTANERDKLSKRSRVKGATVEGIEFTEEKSQPNFFEDTSEKNVGIYARVSTDNSQQTMSYEMQQKYYSELVANRPNWKLIEIYADEGKTGTSTRHREGFNSMIRDCKEGKLDLVITKSVSRFSRNIVDTIAHVRALAAQKPAVGVYFENEGIYTLSADSEMRLSFTAAMAQEEARTRSVASNSSIVMRFSHGMFLTPPLLGYDNDENGQLIINEDEATTVRLIFFMYLAGYSSSEIADKLTTFGRKTKKGNAKWSAGSVYNQLINERHCGAVKSRKTWTPNFLDHLAKKNRMYKDGSTDRKQYTKLNHHEAIVSHADFVAVQKMIANAKYGNRSFLPQLQVIAGGALHGFVSINPRWATFNAEDYIAASASAGEGRVKSTPLIAKHGDIDLRSSEVVRGESFIDAYISCATFNDDTLRFSSTCIRKFDDAEYAELLIHPVRKLLAVRPCAEEHKNAIRWTNFSDGRAFGRNIGCTAYINTLYRLLDWEPGTKYRVRCTLHKVAGEMVAIFDTRDVKIIASQSDTGMFQVKSAFPNYYAHFCKQIVPHSRKVGTISAYNPLPDFEPTPENDLRESIAQIVDEMQSVASEY